MLITTTSTVGYNHPLIARTSFSFDEPRIREFVYSANDTVQNMTFDGMSIVFENETDIDWNQFSVVLFYNEDRVPASTPEGNNNGTNDLGVIIFKSFKRPKGINYPFVVKSENGTFTDDPNVFKLAVYYFGNQSIEVTMSIYVGFFTWLDNDVSTFGSSSDSVPITVSFFILGMGAMIFAIKRKSRV